VLTVGEEKLHGLVVPASAQLCVYRNHNEFESPSFLPFSVSQVPRSDQRKDFSFRILKKGNAIIKTFFQFEKSFFKMINDEEGKFQNRNNNVVLK
tara:strand:- start:2360 stop:2644 length:285 start_codon:yes stop_codon:yes gene_type:complete